jgi:hypothetical protein
MNQKESPPVLPEKFASVLTDFTNDLSTTFPEFKHLWSRYNTETEKQTWFQLYEYCMNVYPERFFDILYQNEEIFKPTSELNTLFLPGVEFKQLFYCDGVSETTQKSIWKYLQLILFMVIGNVKDKDAFKNTANLFQGIDEKELQEKLTEAMNGIGDFFKTMEENASADNATTSDDSSSNNPRAFFENMFGDSAENGMPNPDNLHSHLKSLFGGKLGSLAKELVEELTDDLQEALGLNPEDFNEKSSTKDIFAKLLTNPQKFMHIVQKINAKFQDKIKSGDLSQEEIMKEAGEMLKKMKEMGGNSKQMNEMFQNMAKSMGGMMPGGNTKNMRVDVNAVDRMMKMQSTKERMRSKLEKKRAEEQAKQFTIENKPNGEKVYRPVGGEKLEKSAIVKKELTDTEIHDILSDIEKINEEAKLQLNKSNAKKKKGKK